MSTTALPISTTALALRLGGLSFSKTDRIEYDGGVDAGRASKRLKPSPPPRPVRIPHSSFRQPHRRRSARGIVRLDPRDGLASKLAGLCLDLSTSSDELDLTLAMESLKIGDELGVVQGSDTVEDIVQEFYRLEALYHRDAYPSSDPLDLTLAMESLAVVDELSVVQGVESVEDIFQELSRLEALYPIDYFYAVDDVHPIESLPCVEDVSPVADLPSKKRSREEYEEHSDAALDGAPPVKRVKVEIERAPRPVRVPHSSIVEARRRLLAKSRVRVRAASSPIIPAPVALVAPAISVSVDVSSALSDRTNTLGIPSRHASANMAATGKKSSGGVKRTRKTASGRENSPFPLSSQRKGSLALCFFSFVAQALMNISLSISSYLFPISAPMAMLDLSLFPASPRLLDPFLSLPLSPLFPPQNPCRLPRKLDLFLPLSPIRALDAPTMLRLLHLMDQYILLLRRAWGSPELPHCLYSPLLMTRCSFPDPPTCLYLPLPSGDLAVPVFSCLTRPPNPPPGQRSSTPWRSRHACLYADRRSLLRASSSSVVLATLANSPYLSLPGPHLPLTHHGPPYPYCPHLPVASALAHPVYYGDLVVPVLTRVVALLPLHASAPARPSCTTSRADSSLLLRAASLDVVPPVTLRRLFKYFQNVDCICITTHCITSVILYPLAPPLYH
ncbi:hypothetical protein DFH06DRAFT_1421088 [Mycena polygramma]|nr:hypothetical protein DFH06DRAFT_1421088 [Mycena polygramma]